MIANSTTIALVSEEPHEITIPAGWEISEGDILTLSVHIGKYTPTNSPVGPSGWTAHVEREDNNQMRAIYSLVASGGEEGSTITVSTGDAARTGTAHLYHATQVNAIEGAPSAYYDNADDEPPPPAITPAWGGKEGTVFLIFVMADGEDINAAPTNYTTNLITSNDSGAVQYMGSSYREANVETETPGAFTLASSTNVVAYTIAIEPGETTPSSFGMNSLVGMKKRM